MTSEFRDSVIERCRTSRLHNDRIRSLVSAESATSLRADFARCAIDLAVEHHSALARVVEAGEYGTGAALLRPLLEAATTGYWFVYVAKCSEIRKFPTTPVDNPDSDIPDLSDMVRSLIPIFPPIKKMSDGLKKGGSAKWMHKYTHGSTPQLNRRVNGGWTEAEVILTLVRADMFVTLAAILEDVIIPSAKMESYAFNSRDELAFELQMKFEVEPIAEQPRKLPDAPLLAEGCGPPFAFRAKV